MQKLPQIFLKEKLCSAAHVHQLFLIFRAEWTQLLPTVPMSEEARKTCADVAVSKPEDFTFKCEFFTFYELHLMVEWFIYSGFFFCLNHKLSI